MRKTSALVFITLLASSFTVNAKMGDLQSFKKTYPAAVGKITSCVLCHTNGNEFNPYGQDYKNAGRKFKEIEALDSDGDGVDNINEIVNTTYPGDASQGGRALFEGLTEEEIQGIVDQYYNR